MCPVWGVNDLREKRELPPPWELGQRKTYKHFPGSLLRDLVAVRVKVRVTVSSKDALILNHKFEHRSPGICNKSVVCGSRGLGSYSTQHTTPGELLTHRVCCIHQIYHQHRHIYRICLDWGRGPGYG